MTDQIAQRIETHGQACHAHPRAEGVMHPSHRRGKERAREVSGRLAEAREAVTAGQDFVGQKIGRAAWQIHEFPYFAQA